MRPVLFHVGSFPVHTFGVLLMIAFLAAIAMLRARAERFETTKDAITDVAFWTVISGVLLGARGAERDLGRGYVAVGVGSGRRRLLAILPCAHHGRLPERPMGADCKSVAKASKVRILHLPPPAQTAPDQRKR